MAWHSHASSMKRRCSCVKHAAPCDTMSPCHHDSHKQQVPIAVRRAGPATSAPGLLLYLLERGRGLSLHRCQMNTPLVSNNIFLGPRWYLLQVASCSVTVETGLRFLTINHACFQKNCCQDFPGYPSTMWHFFDALM